jgi:type II secretory pathway component PulF
MATQWLQSHSLLELTFEPKAAEGKSSKKQKCFWCKLTLMFKAGVEFVSSFSYVKNRKHYSSLGKVLTIQAR